MAQEPRGVSRVSTQSQSQSQSGTTGPDVALRVRGVGMRFGGLWALDDVTFDVPRGAVLGLIGPNGSGKTTLMNVVSGVYKPTRGEVLYGGRRISDVPTHAVCHLGIARTFQVVKPFANLTVRENVAVGAMYGRRGRKAIDARVVRARAGAARRGRAGARRVASGQRPDDSRP